MELCDASSRDHSFFRSKYHHYFLPLQFPSILSSALSLGPSIFPLLRCSLFPPFSPSRTCVCARAFKLFSCFYAPLVFSLPKYNWRCDAPVSLSHSSLCPPPLARPLLLAKTVRSPLAHPASLTSANPGRVPAIR